MFIAILVQLGIVVVLAGIPLIARFGLNGVGYTMALAYSATAAIQWYWFLHMRPTSALRTPFAAAPTARMPTPRRLLIQP